MRQIVTGLVLALALVTSVGSPATRAQEGVVQAFEGATLIDTTSATAVRDAVVVVRAGNVVAAGPRNRVAIPRDAQRLNLRGKTIVPGMFTLHGHVGITEGMEGGDQFYTADRVQRDVNMYLYYGFMHMLSLGNDQPLVRSFIDEQRQGRRPGARLYTAGFGFGAVGGWLGNSPNLNRPTTPGQAREMVARLATEKVDALKLWQDDGYGRLKVLPPEIYEAIFDEGHKRGLKTYVHVYYLNDAKEMARRGVDVFAHSIRDAEVDDELLDLMRRRGTAQAATLARHHENIVYVDGADFLDDAGLPLFVPPDALATVRSAAYRERLAANANLARQRTEYDRAARNVARMAAAGVTLVLGTDSGTSAHYPGIWEQQELELHVAAGIAPMRVLQMATINSARVLGVADRFGSLEPGKAADFIVVDGDPLVDIKTMRRISRMWMNGREVERQGLRSARATP
jgi:imidazolonepropionase-like amidohydrolase